MASQPSIDEVWRRIEAHEGAEFRTKRGLPLTYSISGSKLTPSRSDYPLAVSDFEKALALVPIESVAAISNLVRGPSYIWAILHDKRIRQADW